MIPSGYKNQKVYSAVPTDGLGDLTFARASTATRVNASGLIEAVASGVPRLDYLGSTCPKLLLEPQRTNLLLNSVWANTGGIPTSWNIGFNTGTLTPVLSVKNTSVSALTFVCSTQRSEISQTFTVNSGTVLCFSSYVESAPTPTEVRQMLRVGPITGAGTTVFLKNNVPVSETTLVEAGSTYAAQFTCTLTGSFQFRIGAGVLSNITANITISMPQYEVGAYATSYIPTTTASVTRVADAASKTGISSLIGQTEGTIYAEVDIANPDKSEIRSILNIGDGTSGNRIALRRDTSGRIIVICTVSSSTLGSVQTGIDQVGVFKIAVAYAVGDLTMYINGGQAGTTTIASVPACSRIDLGQVQNETLQLNDRIAQALVFKTRLTNAQLAELTA